MLTDTHCHLYLPDFDADRDAMIQRAIEAGITRFVLPNIDLKSVDALTRLCRQYPNHCFPLIGLHPCSVDDSWQQQSSRIGDYLKHSPVQWYGIGETGLDYYWSRQWIAQQKQNLEQHIRWAKSYRLPLILHSRNAVDDCIEMVSLHRHPDLKGIFHCFSGSLQQAERIVEAGFLLGIGGVVTFPKGNLDQVLPHIPLDCIVLETDSPYLAPVPHRGKRNESSYLILIAQRVAELYRVTPEQVAERTTANACRLFGFPF